MGLFKKQQTSQVLFVKVIVFAVIFTREICLSKSSFEKDLKTDERYLQGREQFEVVKKNSEMPNYGQCWKSALSKLESGCKQLTDEVQHRLALSFTTCYLEKMGREGYPCGDDEDIEKCTKNMSDFALTAMTTFFTHTQNICFFLQSQIWQEQTDQTVSRLAETSENVVQQLEESTHLQDRLLTQQNTSLKNQEEMLEKSQSLSNHIQSSSDNIGLLMREFKDSTNEQRMMITEVFDRVAKLQSIMVGEFTGFYSFIFYTLSILVCYLLTSTNRTSGARFYLFTVMTLDVLVERFVISYYGSNTESHLEAQSTEPDSLLYTRLWQCRKIFSLAGLVVLAICALRYKDYNKINNSLLIDIQKQNAELKMLLSPRRGGGGDVVDSVQVAALTGLQKTPAMITHTAANISEDESSSGSDLESDHTYVADEDSGNESDTSVMTQSSVQSNQSVLDELASLRASTPCKEWTPVRNLRRSVSREPSPSPSSAYSQNTRRANRTSTALLNERPGIRHYNLRQRTSNTTQNPVLANESEKDFYKMVKHLSRVVQRNASKTRYTLERTNQDTSSDDM